jgi:WD40 repeat protein
MSETPSRPPEIALSFREDSIPESTSSSDVRTVAMGTARLVLPGLSPVTFSTHTPMPRFPHRLGGYEVRRELGRGGMGIVYEGFDPKLRRSVALKVLREVGTQASDLAIRFRTEAEAVAQLQHPHIVQVIEVGDEGGVPFVALEYLAGGSLHQRIAGAPQPPYAAAEWVETLARATAHAHAHGVLHRDLKPGNILFTADDVPKLTDFGTARLFDPRGGEDWADPGLTRVGEVIGTPQYMAPEQARGSPDEVGPAADVYSLGAILYELLTGRPPFTGVDPYDVIHAVRTQQPVPPRSLQPKLPRDLETICLKCLEKDPKRRYATADELAADLSRFRVGDSIRARPAGPARRLWIHMKHNPVATGVLIGMILAGVAGASAFGWQFQKTAAARDIAIFNFREAQAKSTEAETARAETEQKKFEAEAHLKRANWNLYRGVITQAQLMLEQSNIEQAATLLESMRSDEPGWEYDFLRGQTGSTLWEYSYTKRLSDSDAAWPHHLALSPDGTLLAVASASPYESGVPNKQVWEVNPTTLVVFRVSDGQPVFSKVSLVPMHTTHVSWSSDRVVTLVDYKATIRSWNVETGRQVVDLPGTGLVEPMANHVVASEDGLFARPTARGTMEVLHPLRPEFRRSHPIDSPNLAALNPGGTIIVVCNRAPAGHFHLKAVDLERNRTLYEWDSNNGRCEFAPGGNRLFTYDNDGGRESLIVREARTGTVAWRYVAPVPTTIGCVKPSPDHRRIAVQLFDPGELHVIDAATGRLESLCRGVHGWIHDIAFSPDGSWLASVGDDSIIRLWDHRTGLAVTQLRGHRGSVRRVTFTENGQHLITGGIDERIVCWDLSRVSSAGGIMPPHESGGQGTRMGAITFTPAGRLAILNTERGVTEFDPATGNPYIRRTFEKLALRDAKEIRDYQFAADAPRLVGHCDSVVTGADGSVRPRYHVAVWNSESGHLLHEYETKLDRLYAVAISADGSRIAASGYRRPDKSKGDKEKPVDPRLLIWDTATGTVLADEATDVPVLSIAFAKSGERLAAGFLRPTIKPGPAVTIYNAYGQAIQSIDSLPPPDGEIGRHLAYVTTLTFSPKSETLAGVCWGTNLMFMIDVASGTVMKTVPQNSAITDLAFNPDGTRLAATGYSDVVTLRDTRTWDEVISFVCAPGRRDDWAFPALIQFSRDGRSLAATHWNGEFSLWHVDELRARDRPKASKLRETAGDSAFRFHLMSARAAIRRNEIHAYRFHANELNVRRPPTEALREDWAAIRDAVSPRSIIPSVAGGLAAFPPVGTRK